MRTVEAGIGHPDDNLLPGVGKPGQGPVLHSSGDVYPVAYFRPGIDSGDPKLAVRVEILNGQPLRGKVISSFRGSQTASDYRPGDIIPIPETANLIHEGYWPRRKSEKRS